MNQESEAQLSETDDNRQLSDMAVRLRRVVEEGGGITAVAKRSGVPLGSLNHYVRGREPKASSLLAIAKACDVSINWIISGEEPKSLGVGIAVGPAMPLTGEPGPLPSEPPKLFQIVNMDLLAAAVEGSDAAVKLGRIAPDNWLTRAQLICLLYDGANTIDKNTR